MRRRKEVRLPASRREIAFACDTADCESVFYEAGDDTLERARIRGWGIWDGELMGGEKKSLRLCPRCRDDKSRGTKASRLAPPEGSVPLF